MKTLTEKARFNALKIVRMNFFEKNDTSIGKNGIVEVFAAPVEAFKEERFPPPFKFVYKGRFAEEMYNKYASGEVIHIEAKPEAYQAKVYGIRGRPIHYPNGRVRETVKTRFRILGMWKGVKIGRWR